MTLRYRTNKPLEVNITMLNSILIGGRDQAFRWVSLDKVASPENEYSAPPENRAILHIRSFKGYAYFHSTTFSLRSHFALPCVLRHFPSAVFRGVGILTTTSVAYSLGEKFAFIAIS